MISNCKYIMLRGAEPILFPLTLTHATVANALNKGREVRGEVTSAGFVTVLGIGIQGNPDIIVRVFGESVSLKLKPAKDDFYWIKKMLSY